MDPVEMNSYFNDSINLNHISDLDNPPFDVDSIILSNQNKRYKYKNFVKYCGPFSVMTGIYSLFFLLGYKYYNHVNDCSTLLKFDSIN
jgi:hypothetical protein